MSTSVTYRSSLAAGRDYRRGSVLLERRRRPAAPVVPRTALWRRVLRRVV